MWTGWGREEDWFRAILETIDEGIHVVDTEGVTVIYNQAAGRIDGLKPEDVLGKHVLSVFPSLDEEASTLLQVLRTGRSIHNRQQTYTNYRGVKVHTVNTSLPVVVKGQVVGAMEIAKDLTSVKLLADEVLRLQAQVAGKLGKAHSPRERGSVETPRAQYRFEHILTQDETMMAVLQRARMAARTSSPVLVYGETGTGKELLVQAIHNASPRALAPFLAVNCAALPASLL
ncbi:MAG: sigma 54-interacting transcriptional regulator [Alicyclobacillus herbarius]|nr:sigma 54-interacting transcriptional regulator [Alicyclobacillus herbarius]